MNGGRRFNQSVQLLSHQLNLIRRKVCLLHNSHVLGRSVNELHRILFDDFLLAKIPIQCRNRAHTSLHTSRVISMLLTVEQKFLNILFFKFCHRGISLIVQNINHPLLEIRFIIVNSRRAEITDAHISLISIPVFQRHLVYVLELLSIP